MRPKLFVGSSSKVTELIDELTTQLYPDIEVVPWHTSGLPLSQSTLDGVEALLDAADFGAFILAPDDAIELNGQRMVAPRDNVLFELGFSFGRLGRRRTFILAPTNLGPAFHNASDLRGITVVPYESGLDEEVAMRAPAAKLRKAIAATGLKDRAEPAAHVLTRGDTTNIDTIVDAALHVFESRSDYASELGRRLFAGELVPAKFQFALPHGGRHWLELCKSSEYLYYNTAKRLLREHATELASAIRSAAGTAAVDYVGLGSGDGSKDNLILRALSAHASGREHLYYYPIDVSESLLVEAVRHISRRGPRSEYFRCKPVMGDFTNFRSLRRVVEYRPNVNLFSVLGNTVGSADERDILESVAGAMLPGDLVLLEVNIGEPDRSKALLEDNAASQWDLSTLDSLGIARDPDSCELSQETLTNLSMVRDTRTLVSYAVPKGGQRLKLSAMHHYNFARLKEVVEQELEVQTICEIDTGDGVGIILAQHGSVPE